MQNVDCPITINVGGEVFMTSLATVQTLPDTLLAKLTNSLYLNPDTNAVANGSLDTKLSITDNPVSNHSRFIHVIPIASKNNNGNTECAGDSQKNAGKNTKTHNQTQNSICPQNSSAISAATSSSNVPLIFVDRNPVLMPYILDTYRLGQLHLPSNVCSPVIRSELQFWGISEDLISACCWKKFDEGVGSLRIVDIITQSLYNPFDKQKTRDGLPSINKIWLTMERPSYSLAARIWCAIYFSFIFISMVVFSLGSLPKHRRIHPEFKDLRAEVVASNESVSLVRMMSFTAQIEEIGITNKIIDVFFTIEFLIRLVTCPSKRKFLRSGHNIVDMIILGVTWMNFLLETGFASNPGAYGEFESHINIIFSCCVVVRVLRVCHIAKHMPAMKLMYLSGRESASELLLLVAVVGSGILMFGTAIFLVETFDKLPSERGQFKHVPLAMWWAVITMTTVGYGDMYPTTTAGYFVGVLCAMSGLLLIAMPIAVIATNFADYFYNMTSRDHMLKREEYIEVNSLNHPAWVPENGDDTKAVSGDSRHEIKMTHTITEIQTVDGSIASSRKNGEKKDGKANLKTGKDDLEVQDLNNVS